MTKFLILFIFFTAHIISYGQLRSMPVPKKPPTKKQGDRDIENQSCIYKNKISKNNRLKIFPFNKAYKVQLVSFVKPDSVQFTYLLPMKGKLVNYSRLKEVITLDSIQINSLTDILYNYGYKGIFYSFVENQCLYYPENAILFFDKKDSVFAFMEFYFGGEGYRLSEKRISLGDLCTEKYDLIKRFFIKNGIGTGTISAE